jgi:hypothetical protein
MSEEVIYDERNLLAQNSKFTSTKIKLKGRGHKGCTEDEDRYDGRGGIFEKIEQDSLRSGPAQCMSISFCF